ncbi:MAG: hypothetical protein IPJ11_08930 [Gemmatimonadetes bacterium]|nr:hypothetical protein [Gemmatimonadota bacterium]
MRWTLALRHLLVRPGRAVVLLGGYAIGVAVMIVLLSVGTAMLEQSRDVALVGGGDLTVLPEGIDLEAMRTGGMTGLFFGIDRARFVTRELLGGARHRATVAAVAPVLERKWILLHIGDSTWTVRAGGELPDVMRRVGSADAVVSGEWRDAPQDVAWQQPNAQMYFDALDHFHRPAGNDSTWAEWHYVNLVVSADEWWYITYLVGGDVNGTRWGGQLLVTRRRPDGVHERFVTEVPGSAVRFDTTRADVALGASTMVQRDGVYELRGSAGATRFRITLRPDRHRQFPAVELSGGEFRSGYVVPAVTARADGELCTAAGCRVVRDIAAYHDHNWGSWREVTWEWGTARGATHALLYGGVRQGGAPTTRGTAPYFLALLDTLGVQQVYRFREVSGFGAKPVATYPGVTSPESLLIVATRRDDSLRVRVRILDVHATRPLNGGGRIFLQMRGAWSVVGRAAGVVVADSGLGFFERWVTAP